MLQRRLLVLMLLSRFVWPVEPSPRSNHLNSIIADAAPSAIDPAAAAAVTTYDKQQQQQPQQQSQAWQPSAAHSNWIILQAATAAAGVSNHRYDRAPSHSATRTQLLRSYGARNDFQLQRLPGNYYAYNRSTGNYQLPPPTPTPAGSSARVVQPYVLATSKVRRRPVPLGVGAVDTLPQDNNFVRHNDRNDNNNDNTDGENNEIDTNDAGNKSDAGDNMPQTRVVRQDTDSSNKNSPNGDNGIDIGDGDANTFEAEAELNEILLPLENALDRVRHFCDVVKRFISDVDEDTDDKGHSASPATNAARVAVTARSDVPPSVSAEVQGRHAITTLPPRSLAKSLTAAGAFGWPALSAAPAAASVGTGRAKKLKKKLRKLLLPLLIAYKLKFLTLIPVLIGGLTLLVGTTGLAGFFFALFTAVMSLKSGGGKSVSVKKI